MRLWVRLRVINKTMELNLIDILLIIITVAISIIAIKITFTFDINEYLKSRKEDLKNKIKNSCTHANITVLDNSIAAQSTFVSPPGTTNYICEKCQLIVYSIDQNSEMQRIQYFVKNIEQYKKQEEKFNKLLKKGGYI